jgi:hypothetical protein
VLAVRGRGDRERAVKERPNSGDARASGRADGILRRVIHAPHRAPVLLSTLVLAACSGGGATPPAATFEPSAFVDEQNAVAAARTGFRAAFDVIAVARIAAVQLSTPPPDGEPPATTIHSQVVFGLEGGQLLHTWEDRDASDDYTTGDVFTLSFEAYGELGLVLDGLVVFEDLAIDADPVAGAYWSIDGAIRFLNLDVGSGLGGDPERLNGTLRLRRESRAFTLLTNVWMLDDFAYRGDRILAGSNLRWDDRLNLTCAWFADGVVDVPALGGELRFATKYPLTGYNFFALPFLGPAYGVLEVFGANRARVQVLPADDFASLSIEFEANDDDEPELRVDTTWFDFLGN